MPSIRLTCRKGFLALLLVSCTERYEPKEGVSRTPLVIEARRDVEVHPDSAASQQRGVLYGDTSMVIKSGERFEMQLVGVEGDCRILYKAQQLSLNSCPWLPGFRDHQWDIFAIVNRE